jgi:hypothetical protein
LKNVKGEGAIMRKELKNTFDTTYLSIEYDPVRKFYYTCWKGYVKTEHIKEGSITYLQLLQSNPCPRLLIDYKEVVGSWHRALNWLTKEWAPLASNNGLRWLAIVVSPGSFAVGTAEELQKRLDGIPLQVEVFKDVPTSREWLESQIF